MFLQVRKEMVVTWGYFWTVKWVCDSIPSKFVSEIGCYKGDSQTSVVLMEMHSLREHAPPLVLNSAAKILQRIIIAVPIDCIIGRDELAQYTFLFQKTLAFTLPYQYLNFHGFGDSGCFY